jgi:uncharacterized alkaline shock family protein YloU
MAQSTSTPTGTPMGTTGAAGAPEPSPRSPDARRAPVTGAPSGPATLASEQGTTTIADVVVAKIAGIAAREVPGVHELLTQGAGGAIAGLAQRVTGGDQRAQGVNVEVGEREAAVDLRMTVDYGVSIHQVAEAVRRNVVNRLQAMTGLVVREVNIAVDDLFFPEDVPPPAVSIPPAAPRVQ